MSSINFLIEYTKKVGRNIVRYNITFSTNDDFATYYDLTLNDNSASRFIDFIEKYRSEGFNTPKTSYMKFKGTSLILYTSTKDGLDTKPVIVINNKINIDKFLNELYDCLVSNHKKVKPSEIKLSEVKPAEVKPTEIKPTEIKHNDIKLTEIKPTEIKPAEIKPAENIGCTRVSDIQEPGMSITMEYSVLCGKTVETITILDDNISFEFLFQNKHLKSIGYYKNGYKNYIIVLSNNINVDVTYIKHQRKLMKNVNTYTVDGYAFMYVKNNYLEFTDDTGFMITKTRFTNINVLKTFETQFISFADSLRNII